MGSFVRFIGRVLFAVILFTSAYQKILQPEQSKSDFVKGYAKIHSIANTYGLTFLPSESEFSSRVLLAVKFVGLIEALIASFIIIGEQKGGLMSLLYFLVYGALNFVVSDFTGILGKSFAQREKLVAWVAYIGGSFLLASRSYLKA